LTPDNRVIAVKFDVQGANFRVGKSRELFSGRGFGNSTGQDMSPDGKRWLFALPVDQVNASPLMLVTNWTASLKH